MKIMTQQEQLHKHYKVLKFIMNKVFQEDQILIYQFKKESNLLYKQKMIKFKNNNNKNNNKQKKNIQISPFNL